MLPHQAHQRIDEELGHGTRNIKLRVGSMQSLADAVS